MRTSRAYREAIARKVSFEKHCISVGGETRSCVQCRKPFTVASKKSLREYCTQRCNNAAWRARTGRAR